MKQTIEKCESESKTLKDSFSEISYFGDSDLDRSKARKAFIDNEDYAPNYKYPKLDSLLGNSTVADKKTAIYRSVLELEASKEHNDPEVTELYLCYHEKNLKKILLVESAFDLYNPISMIDTRTSRRSFADLNEALYGKFDANLYKGLISTEKNRLAGFVPKSDYAVKIKNQLEPFYGHLYSSSEREKDLLNPDDINKLHNYVTDKYANVLGVVPNTDRDVYYDVNQCAQIVNDALKVGGLSELGWVAVENSEKSNPTTNTIKKAIYLPSNTRRNADELRRLIIHEQEVHVRRYENGKSTDVSILSKGTAEYADVEEGLGVMMECAVAGNFDNKSFDRARNRYMVAGLALGADGHIRDARQVYETAWRMIAVQKAGDSGIIDDAIIESSKNDAYGHIENAYRGTQFWMQGVIYTKLKVYYEGLVKNADFFKDRIDNLDKAFKDAFICKYNHTDAKEAKLIKSIISHNKTYKVSA